MLIVTDSVAGAAVAVIVNDSFVPSIVCTPAASFNVAENAALGVAVVEVLGSASTAVVGPVTSIAVGTPPTVTEIDL